MTEQRQSAGRWNEQELRRKPPRIPRMVAYQTKGQLPLTALAIVIIVTVIFVWWISSNSMTWHGM